jgi:Ca2+-transporting ATPase
VYGWQLEAHGPDAARTLAFATLVFSELARAFGARSVDHTFWKVGPFTNPRLLGLVAVSAGLQLALHEFPATRELFGLIPLPQSELAIAAALGLIPVTITELAKLARSFIRARAPRTPTGPASASPPPR